MHGETKVNTMLDMIKLIFWFHFPDFKSEGEIKILSILTSK